jgi:hypothetical protein
MEAHEYQMAVDQVVMLARMSLEVEADEVLKAIDHADTVGPYLDPTAWIRGHEAMGEVKKLVVAFARFQAEAKRQKERLEAESAAAEARALAAVGAGTLGGVPRAR